MTNTGGGMPDLPLLERGFELPRQLLVAIIGDKEGTRVVFGQGVQGPFHKTPDIPGVHRQANLAMDNRL